MKTTAKALIVIVLAAAVFAFSTEALVAGDHIKPALPKGMLGFDGMLKGKVVKKVELGFVIKVVEVTDVWKHNKAKNPKSVIGKLVLINPQWKKESGKWIPWPNHVQLIELLQVGEVINIEVVNDEGCRLHMRELTEEQRDRIEKHGKKEREGDKDREREHDGDREKDRHKEREKDNDREREGDARLPESSKGFSGMVRGKVVKLTDNGFYLKIYKILEVWKNNKARNPKALLGKTVLVRPQWHKGRDGKWRPIERHLHFIGTLETGQELTIEIINDEGKAFHILELSQEQRKIAEKAAHKREKEEREKKSDENEGEEKHLGKGKIEHWKPKFKKKKGDAWAEKGRVVGRMKNSPEVCEIEAIDSSGEQAACARLILGEAYELEWLKPGKYTVRVASPGYETLEIEEVVVKEGHDTVIDLEFLYPKKK